MGSVTPHIERFFVPMDPSNGVLSLELRDGLAYQSITLPESVEKWTIPETTVESLVNSCLFDTDNGTRVWKRRRTVAPEPGENFENAMGVMRRKYEQYELEIKLWNELAFKQGEEIFDLKKKVAGLRGELQQLESMKCLQTEMWRKEAKTLALELRIMNTEMEVMRGIAERDKLELVKAHKLECEALTSQAQQTGRVMKAVHKIFKEALGDKESACREEELPETLLRSVRAYCSTIHCLMVKSANCGECGVNKVLKVSEDPESTGREAAE